MSEGTVQLPKMSDGFLGPQTKFQAYGLSLVSHSQPIIYMQEDQPEVEIILGTQFGTRITVKLVSYERKKECTEYCLIYALPKDEAGPQMLGVYNYLIHFPGNFEDKPFPKQYAMWKDGCYLDEPLSLPRGIKDPMVRFKVVVPKAKDVQVKVGDEWNPLQETEPETFEGFVDFNTGYATGAKAKLNAKFVGDNYNTLLEYSL